MLNKIILMGRLCVDPDFRQTQSGIAVCRFRIAVNRRFKNQQTGEQEADFISCTAWRQTAEFVSRYFQKGIMILVEGELRNNDYTEQNGVKHYSMEVLVNQASFCGSKSESAAQNQQNAPQQTQIQNQQSYGTSPSVPYTAAQSGSQQAAMLGNLDDFEEILSDGEVPF